MFAICLCFYETLFFIVLDFTTRGDFLHSAQSALVTPEPSHVKHLNRVSVGRGYRDGSWFKTIRILLTSTRSFYPQIEV